MKTLVNKYFTLFFIGGTLYLLIELISRRGDTHWTMGIVGGICFVLIGMLNEFLPKSPFWLQALFGGVIVTIVELISGILINLVFQLDVWDYSNEAYQILGQVCLPFSMLWCILSGFAIILDGYLRYWLFGEDKPHYHFFRKNLL